MPEPTDRHHLVAKNTAELRTLGEKPASGSRSEMHGPPTQPPQPPSSAALPLAGAVGARYSQGPEQAGTGSPASRAAVAFRESGPQTQPGLLWAEAAWMAASSDARWTANCKQEVRRMPT
jgi:hypothetical protein